MKDQEAKSIIRRLKRQIKLTPEENQSINIHYSEKARIREQNLGKGFTVLV